VGRTAREGPPTSPSWTGREEPLEAQRCKLRQWVRNRPRNARRGGSTAARCQRVGERLGLRAPARAAAEAVELGGPCAAAAAAEEVVAMEAHSRTGGSFRCVHAARPAAAAHAPLAGEQPSGSTEIARFPPSVRPVSPSGMRQL